MFLKAKPATPNCVACCCMLKLVCALQLRLNKVSELIHNSTHHRNLDMARVSVYFQEIVDTARAPAANYLQRALFGAHLQLVPDCKHTSGRLTWLALCQ